MFMRLVQIKLKTGTLQHLQGMYNQRVIPTLEKVRGCRYAGLLQSAFHGEECISLTLWDSQQEAEAYERSGLFAQLLDESKPYLSDSSEFKVQLSHDLTLEYVPVPEEPTVSAFPVAATSDATSPEGRKHDALWVRIVSLKIRPGKMEEFKRLYEQEVIPTLRSVKGCRYIYLTQRPGTPNEIVSVTSWDSKADADSYETGGLYDRLLEGQRHTLSELYQWKRVRDHDHMGRVATSEDPTVEHYNVLIGKSFK
jgi:heme-degrading monooxygenase HmoA